MVWSRRPSTSWSCARGFSSSSDSRRLGKLTPRASEPSCFLALRFLITPSPGNARFNDATARVCATLYAAICAMHWWTQIVLACEYGYTRWLALFIPFVYDDLDLMYKLFIYRSPVQAPPKAAAPSPDDPELTNPTEAAAT